MAAKVDINYYGYVSTTTKKSTAISYALGTSNLKNEIPVLMIIKFFS